MSDTTNPSWDSGDANRAAGGDERSAGGDERGAGWVGLPPLVRSAAAWSAALLLVAGAMYVIGLVAVRLAPLTLAIVATLFLTALFHPVTEALRRRVGLPDSLAALAAVVLLIFAVVAPGWLMWTLAARDFRDLANRIRDGITRVRDILASGSLPISQAELDRFGEQIRSWLAANAVNVAVGAFSLFEIVATILLVVVLLFFVLKDGRRMWAWLLERLPRHRRAMALGAAEAAWLTLTRYVRGTVVIAAIDAVGIGIALLVLRVPLAFPLTLLVFIGSFVPIVGATVTGSLAVLVALATRGPLTALLVAVAVIVVQQVEGNLLEPLIMKRQVRLHPVVVLVVVTAGALAWGVAGAFIAVPVAAVAYQVGRTLMRARAEAAGPEP